MWKIIYGLATLKQGQEDPFKGTTNEEEEDTSQFRVVSHPSKYNIDKICDNIKENVDMSELKNIEFG